jgi:thiol reductant ABC exporter CydD subunit
MRVRRSLIRETGPSRWWLAGTIGLSVLQAVLLVSQAYLISRVISAAFLDGQGLSALQDQLLWLVILTLLRMVITTLARVAAVRASTRVKHDIRSRLMQQLHRMGPITLSREHRGELVHTAQEGIESLDAYVSEYLPQIALAGLIPLTIIAFILPLDPISAMVLLLTAPLIPVFMVLIGDAAEEVSQRQWKALGELSSRFLDVLQGLPTLKIFGRSKDQVARLRKLGHTHRTATMRVLRVAFLSALVLELVATISTAIVAVQVGLRLLYGRLGFEQAFFVLILAPEFYIPLRTLGAKFHAGISGAVALERVLEFLNRKPHDIRSGHRITHFKPGGPPAIRFEDVHMRFPDRRESALHDFDLTIPPGSCTAFVGPTGAGKSTVAHLLLGFIEPERGRIFVNDTPLNQIEPDAWRRCVAWVPQRPYLFNTSVLENLRMAAPGASMQAVRTAAHQAMAHGFITNLPQGYDTVVGENALHLSAGQAQRIALARAFLKDAPLVILDEATANLDRESESSVIAAAESLIKDRTALLIAHRLDMIAGADQIVVLVSGKILERGAHVDLMQGSGLYAQLQKVSRGAE